VNTEESTEQPSSVSYRSPPHPEGQKSLRKESTSVHGKRLPLDTYPDAGDELNVSKIAGDRYGGVMLTPPYKKPEGRGRSPKEPARNHLLSTPSVRIIWKTNEKGEERLAQIYSRVNTRKKRLGIRGEGFTNQMFFYGIASRRE